MHTMFAPASMSKGPSNAHFCGTSYPLGECQPALGIKFAGDYLILSSNLLILGMQMFTSHDASSITPYVNRDPIRFQYDPIMNKWGLYGSPNCLYVCPLSLLKGDCLFNGAYFHIKQ